MPNNTAIQKVFICDAHGVAVGGKKCCKEAEHAGWMEYAPKVTIKEVEINVQD